MAKSLAPSDYYQVEQQKNWQFKQEMSRMGTAHHTGDHNSSKQFSLQNPHNHFLTVGIFYLNTGPIFNSISKLEIK